MNELTIVQKGMLADDPKTPEIMRMKYYEEINFETNKVYDMVKLLMYIKTLEGGKNE